MGRRVTPAQAGGTEYAGVNFTPNQVQPRPTWNDLSAAEQRGLIVRTDQKTNPAAPSKPYVGQAVTNPLFAQQSMLGLSTEQIEAELELRRIAYESLTPLPAPPEKRY